MAREALASPARRALLIGRPRDRAVPDHAVARLAGDCLEEGGTACRLCEDACGARAIRFRPLGRGRSSVTIDAGLCTGCGDCAPVCPTGAIAIAGPSREVA